VMDGRARVRDDVVADETLCAVLRVGGAGRGREYDDVEFTTDLLPLGRGRGPWYLDSRNGTGPQVSMFGRLLYCHGEVLLPKTSPTLM
jgi:hypothetical protein